MFSGGIDKDQWHEMGYEILDMNSLKTRLLILS